ncbi:TPA: hypothetical protein N0F65_005168 [Lagenidium giganteum]|uniref:Uncharacterized protein n=1 Tax=Lagenidium giganteum TaxID=4803 RepID=A0AAV2YXB0_9STRA|nr:TPA: hypothetical protein N0F65_005168 [Lagenidium giganteum]
MVATPARLLSYTAVASAVAVSVQAAPIGFNPYHPLPVGVKLDKSNPAYGAPTRNAVPPVLLEAPIVANATNEAPRLLENTDPSNHDINALEQFFKTKMDTNLDKLNRDYSSFSFKPAPWPSSYWPIYADGINQRWAGDNVPAPSEKYAKAFGLNVDQFTAAISNNNGVLSQSGGKACKSNSDCSRQDGEACGKRRGESSGYCIATWFGICHAWAPAAILEPEPKCPVTYNGVTFQPFDIKALLTQVYDGANVGTVFMGARYDGSSDSMDRFGRFKDPAHRDLGPGFFHIALTNVVGRFKQSFVLDVDPSSAVWNQPVRGYQIKKSKIWPVWGATSVFFPFTIKYPFNADARKLAHIEIEVQWVNESGNDGPLVSTGIVDQFTEHRTYEYVLELDDDHNILGGEWLHESKKDHPDFMWFSTERPRDDTVTNVGLSYANVQKLLKQSLASSC